MTEGCRSATQQNDAYTRRRGSIIYGASKLRLRQPLANGKEKPLARSSFARDECAHSSRFGTHSALCCAMKCLARPNLRIPAPERGECLRLYNRERLKIAGRGRVALKITKTPKHGLLGSFVNFFYISIKNPAARSFFSIRLSVSSLSAVTVW